MCCNPDQLPNLISYHSLLLLLFSQTSLLSCLNTRSLLLPQGLCTCCLLYPSTYLCLTGFPEHLNPGECSSITQALSCRNHCVYGLNSPLVTLKLFSAYLLPISLHYIIPWRRHLVSFTPSPAHSFTYIVVQYF